VGHNFYPFPPGVLISIKGIINKSGKILKAAPRPNKIALGTHLFFKARDRVAYG